MVETAGRSPLVPVLTPPFARTRARNARRRSQGEATRTAGPGVSALSRPRGRKNVWLRREDSNLHPRLQRPLSCRWTTPQWIGGGRETRTLTATERLARVRTGCPASWASPPGNGGEGEIRTLAADGLGAVAVRWAPCSPFPLHGPLGRTSTSTTGFVTRGSVISLRGECRRHGIDRLGDQPWDRTTFSRASAERYDHTSSLVGLEPTAGVEPAPARYEGAVLPATLRRRGPGSRTRTPILR